MAQSIIHKMKYKFHKIGLYIYSIKYYYEDHKNKNNLIIFIKSIIYCSKIFNNNSLFYEYLEIPITTNCNLKCKKCANLIPCYKNNKDYDLNILLKSIKTFLKCINNIVYIRVLGGEPFLSKNLYPVIKLLEKSNKIQRIEIVTNGTVIPKDKKLINILKNPKIIISISKYPNMNVDNLIKLLKNNSIKYKIIKRKYWYDYGEAFNRNKSPKELKKQFKSCNNICKSMINGQIHFCPRSSHGTDLGIINNNKNDYIDILDNKNSLKEKKELLNHFFKKQYIEACNYCDFATSKCKKIPVAEQRTNKRM